MSIRTKPLIIAVIQQTPDIGGAETYMLSLLAEFEKMGSSIVLASNLVPFLERGKKYAKQVVFIPFLIDVMGDVKGLLRTISRTPRAIIYYSQLLLQLKRSGTDVILMSGFTEKMLVTFLSHFIRIPVVWIEYGPLRTVFQRNWHIPYMLYRMLYRIPFRIIVPSLHTYQSLVRDAQISPSRLVVIPCGVVVNQQMKRKKRETPYQDRFIIGCVSRLTDEKGQDYLIRATETLQKSIPNVLVLLIGEGPDKLQYLELINRLHLSSYIKLLGFVPDVTVYYDMMDLFVFPTVWELEGFGVVLPEAMSHKLPIVAFNTGPVGEIVTKDVGIVVPPKDTDALIHAIESMASDKEKRKKLGVNGYEKMKKIYDIDVVSNKIFTLLQEAAVYGNK